MDESTLTIWEGLERSPARPYETGSRLDWSTLHSSRHVQASLMNIFYALTHAKSRGR